jgi:hypothetical protein
MTMREPNDMDILRRRLARLRQGLWLWHFGAGASRILGVLALLALVSLLIDRSLRMDLVQRAISLCLALGALLALAWRELVRPMTRRIGAESLLLRVERSRPELKGRLVAAWEFAAMAELPEGASPVLVQAAIEQGRVLAEGTTFRGVLDWARFRQRIQIGAVALAAMLSLALGAPDTMRLWFARNVLLQDVAWPQLTHLSVQGVVNGTLRVPAGGDLDLIVRAEGEQPDEVRFRYADKTGNSYSEQIPRVGDAFSTVFRNVSEPFKLRISGGDDQTGWIPVELVPRPEITSLAVSVEPPAYTGRRRAVLDARTGIFPVLAGSSVVLDGRASQGLREVNVAVEANRLLALNASNAAAFSIRLAPEQVKSATYRIQAVATNGVPTLRPMTVGLRVEPDRPPRVTASLDGIGQMILPRAVVPVVCDLQDDYGVASAWLEYQCQSPTGGSSGPVQSPLALPSAPATGGVVRVSHTLEIASLHMDVDATMSLRAAAKDGNTLTGPGLGQSASFTLRVVTEEELRRELIRREQTARQRLERLIQEQRALSDESRLFASSEDSAIRRDEARLLRSEKRQKQILPALTSITAGIAQIRAEAFNNRLEPEPSPLLKRLDGSVLGPLRDIAAGIVPETADRVTIARQKTSSSDGPKAWRDAEAAQRRMIAALMDVRKNLLSSDEASELVRIMEEILSGQRKVISDTKKDADKAISDIFDKPKK